MHKDACKAAMAQYARSLVTPGAMVLNMQSPNNAFW